MAQASPFDIVEGPQGAAPSPFDIVEGPPGHDKPPSGLSAKTAARVKAMQERRATPTSEPVSEFLQGVGQEAIGRVQTLAKPIRKAFGMKPAEPPPEATTPAMKVGRFAEQAGEFAVPEAAAGKVAGVVKAGRLATTGIKTALTGAGGYAVAKGQKDPHPLIAGALTAVGPLAEFGPAAVKGLRSAAGRSLAKFFGESELTPMKVRQGIADMVPTALQSGIPASWEAWAKQTRAGVTQAGERLGEAVKGAPGSHWTSIQPVRQALEEYADRVGRIVHREVTPKGITQELVTVKNQAAVTASNNLIKRLTDIEGAYGEQVPARVLHDLKGTWNRIAKWAKMPGATARDFVMTERAEAARTGAKAIADVLDQKSPKLSELDQAYHVAKDLQHAVTKAAFEATGRGETAADALATKIVSGVKRYRLLGASSGATAGAAAGYRKEGVTGAVEGALVGGLAGSMLEKAFQSPAWQLRTPRLLSGLADAIERGDTAKIKTLVLPLLAKSGAGSPAEAPKKKSSEKNGEKPQASLTGLEKATHIGPDKGAEARTAANNQIEQMGGVKLGMMPMPELGPTAKFLGWQRGAEGLPNLALYVVDKGPLEGLTVSKSMLERLGIEIPSTPPFDVFARFGQVADPIGMVPK